MYVYGNNMFSRLRYSITSRQYVLAGNISDQSGVRTQHAAANQILVDEGGGY